jgi:hypothetical protein
MWLVLIDALLALGATLRLTRFIVADDVPGRWWIKDPLDAWMHGDPKWDQYEELVAHRNSLIAQGADPDTLVAPVPPLGGNSRLGHHRYIGGLSCPYCMSVWMAAFVTLTLLFAGGLGEASEWWRYPAGFLTLAWVTGHVAARMGDTDPVYQDEEE